MAEEFSADQAIVEESGRATSYMEDQIFQLGRSIGIDAPPSASAKGEKGTLLADSSFLYVCVETDTWLRVAIATW